MREFSDTRFNQPPKHEPASAEGMKRVFLEWGQGPETAFNDPKICAFGTAAWYLLENDHDYRGLVEDMLDFRNEPEFYQKRTNGPDSLRGPKQMLTDEIACNLFLRAVMLEKWKLDNHVVDPFTKDEMTKLEHFSYNFLEGHEDPVEWLRTFDAIYNSLPAGSFQNSRFDELAENLKWRIIQSNKSERYKGIKIAIDRYREVLPEKLRILEIGASLGEGLKKILWGTPFTPTEMLGTEKQNLDPKIVSRIRHAIDRPANIEYAINNDLFDLTNANDILWLLISSHYPREFGDKNKISEFLNLARTDFPSVLGFVYGDASNQDFVNNVQKATVELTSDPEAVETKKPNVAVLCTVMYECSEDEIKAFYDHLLEALDPKENSMIIVQDLIEPAPEQPFGMMFSDNFRIPDKYRLAVIFPFSSDPTPIILGHWDSARCNQFTPYPETLEHYISIS